MSQSRRRSYIRGGRVGRMSRRRRGEEG